MPENRPSPAQVNLSSMTVVKCGQITFAQRLCKAGQDCAGIQLIRYQQRAMLERKRFESVVNDVFQTTLKGKK